MMQMCQPYAYLSVSASNFVSNKSNKENVLLKWYIYIFFLFAACAVCVCFYECKPSVRLQRVGVQGLLEKVCRQQRFFFFFTNASSALRSIR